MFGFNPLPLKQEKETKAQKSKRYQKIVSIHFLSNKRKKQREFPGGIPASKFQSTSSQTRERNPHLHFEIWPWNEKFQSTSSQTRERNICKMVQQETKQVSIHFLSNKRKKLDAWANFKSDQHVSIHFLSNKRKKPAYINHMSTLELFQSTSSQTRERNIVTMTSVRFYFGFNPLPLKQEEETISLSPGDR